MAASVQKALFPRNNCACRSANCGENLIGRISIDAGFLVELVSPGLALVALDEERVDHHEPAREFFIDNLLVRIHFIILMIRWTGLAPWECEFPYPGSLTSTFLVRCE